MIRLLAQVATLLVGVATALGGNATAQETTPPPAGAPAPNLTPPPPAPTWAAQPAGDVLALDKITARVTRLTLKIGQSEKFGSLTITLRACVARPADQRPDSAAFLEITDQHPGSTPFGAWMLLSAPAASMFTNPIYDVRAAGCHA